MNHRRNTLFLAAAFVLSGGLFAQDADQIRAKELKERIKKQLAQIDEMLLAADKTSPEAVRELSEKTQKALDELLKDVQTQQSAVCNDIEELVRLAKKSQSGSGQGDPQEGEEQGDQQPQGSPQERERDADVDELKKQEQAGKEESQPKPEGSEGEEPKDGRPDRQKGKQRPGEKPPAELGEFEREDVNGRWGVLPSKMAEQFMSLSPDQFPEQYRKLIEQYYRKANERARQP